MIWGNNWLLDNDNPQIVFFPYPFLDNATVDVLKTSNGYYWDMETIREIFDTRDADLIKKIPLGRHQTEDKLIWNSNDDGVFTVRSCYKVLNGELRAEDRMEWTLIWTLKIPPEIKIFIWQLCTNCLPTKDLLISKRVNCGECCLLCDQETESAWHLFVDCIHARQCWSILGYQPNSAHFSSVQEWFIFLSSSLPRDYLCTVTVCCWEIWRQRNDKIWNNKRIQSAETIVFKTKKYLHDWREAALPSLPVHEESTTVQPKWSKPQEGFHKLNVDAAIDSINGKMGFGCIIKDEHDIFIAAIGTQWDGVFSLREADATVIREALSWIKELKLNKVSVGTDSLQVVNSLKSSIGESSFHVIRSDIKNV